MTEVNIKTDFLNVYLQFGNHSIHLRLLLINFICIQELGYIFGVNSVYFPVNVLLYCPLHV